MTERYSTDIVIIGGGIAGLWLLNRLQRHGYQVLLLEKTALGSGQTTASQGIIHGGLKYALSGKLDGAANVIADMPKRWRDCLAGNGDIDLRGCKLESKHYYMWSESSLRSRIKTFLGSKSLHGRIESVPETQFPDFFQQSIRSGIKGSLYRLPDFVLDTTSLLQTLSKPYNDRIVKVNDYSLSFNLTAQGEVENISVQTGERTLTIDAQRYIFAAGAGNQQLLEAVNNSTLQMQTRPLHMVYIKKTDLPSLYVHCIGNDFSLTPKLTVTSHLAEDGEQVWYLGGELAESGVGKTNAEQISAAKALVGNSFPWVDFTDADWQCFNINRAEVKMDTSHRPDHPFLRQFHNIIVSWPTKLTLSPALGDDLIELLSKDSLTPMQANNQLPAAGPDTTVAIAKPRWEQ